MHRLVSSESFNTMQKACLQYLHIQETHITRLKWREGGKKSGFELFTGDPAMVGAIKLLALSPRPDINYQQFPEDEDDFSLIARWHAHRCIKSLRDALGIATENLHNYEQTAEKI